MNSSYLYSLFPSLRSKIRFARLGGLLPLLLALGARAQITDIVSFQRGNAAPLGSAPLGGLVQGIDGNLYGTTELGGSSNAGSIYGVDTNGNLFNVYSFKGGTNGADPVGSLIQGADGALYGTTLYGGVSSASGGYGTVFRMGLDGTFTRLHEFDNTDGANPYAGLVQAPGGALFGTTVVGGSFGFGSVYVINTNGGGFSPIYSFTGGADGAYPYCQLMIGNAAFDNGNSFLYGTTAEDEVNNGGGFGSVFAVDPSSGAITNFYMFTGSITDGAYPYGGLVQGNDGYLYGTTAGLAPGGGLTINTFGGTVFRVPPFLSGASLSLNLIHEFFGGSDGEYPYASLLKASDGNLYGTTTGTTNFFSNNGTLFGVASGSASYSSLTNFSGATGANPYDTLVQGLDGNLYGTTSQGGSNGGGTVFRFTLPAPPFVLRQPVAQSVFSMTTATLTVLAGGTAPLSYSWQKGTTSLSDTDNISGSATSTLSVSGVSSSDAATYSVIVSNPQGQVQSAGVKLKVTSVKPSVTVKNPAQNAQVTNADYTVVGTASEALGVASVYFQINTQAWALASTSNQWTNWTAAVSLVPGTNTLKVYAVDPYGNTSSTNIIKFLYVLTTTVDIETSGSGTISPNLDGQLLDIGKSYTVTATAAKGFEFTGWTGSQVTSNPKLTFVMAPGLAFTANFADVTAPVITLTAPTTTGQHVSNAVFTVTGKATDNVGVMGVFYQLGAAGWNPVVTANNWATWTAPVTLTPGTNTVAVYATDLAGNRSTNSFKIIYVLSAPIVVQKIGSGTITPDLDGELLAIGQTYTMTAAAAKGFKFTGWTGSTSNDNPKLTFQMASNLTFTANFADGTAPMLTLTAPAASGMHVSNAVFDVTGKATDNEAVTGVSYQLNSAGWYPAATANNWATWIAGITLVPGTNVLQVVATDAAGNHSATNTVKIIYVLSAPIVVQKNGLGTITPDFEGDLLAIGQTYSMTAAAAKGSKFTGWTGSVSNANPKLTFQMVSNLTFIANFADGTAPMLTVTTPAASGAHVSNAVFNITGKATDNEGVTGVSYQLNSAGWYPAATANNWATWIAGLTLVPGTNIVEVYATDAAGNHSATNTVKIIYVLSAPIVVQQNGPGTIKPNLNGNLLAIGQTYSMTATPAKGIQFAGWTGSITNSNAKLTFVMASNLTLIANFADRTAPTIKVSAPTANQKVKTANLTVKGTAADNVGVTAVYYQLNNLGWNLAAGTKSWTAPVTLTDSTNVIQAYAVDAAGNQSTTAVVHFTFAP